MHPRQRPSERSQQANNPGYAPPGQQGHPAAPYSPAAAGSAGYYGQPAAQGANSGGYYGQPAAGNAYGNAYAAYSQPAASGGAYGARQQPAANGYAGYYGQAATAWNAAGQSTAGAARTPAPKPQTQPASSEPYRYTPQPHRQTHYARPVDGGAPTTPREYAAAVAAATANRPGQDPNRVLNALRNLFPKAPDAQLQAAMRTRRTVEGATHWIREMIGRGLLNSDGSPANGKVVGPPAKAKSIRDKFSSSAAVPNPQQFAYQPGAFQQQHQQQQQYSGAQVQASVQTRKVMRKYADDEFSGDEDDGGDESYNQAEAYEFEKRVLAFLNTAQAASIMDVSGCTSDMAAILIKKRPFATLAAATKVDVPGPADGGVNPETGKRRRGASRKSVGSKIVDASLSTLRGYEAVDSLIQECAKTAKRVNAGTTAWGLDLRQPDKLDLSKELGGGFFKEKPKLLADSVELKDYQQVGINWLKLLYDLDLSAILADEMGLGKTCQVISFLAYLKEHGEAGPHLVVCPSSTLENWLREFQRFAPGIAVEPYYGSQPERAEIREQIINNMGNWDVLVTTYNLATGGKADMAFLKSLGFNVCVYDEGHLLKNSQSERYNKLMRLRANFRVLLTGTPLQNNLRELVSLLSFIVPSQFQENKDALLEVFKFKAKTNTDNNADETEKNGDEEKSQLLSEQRILKAKTMMTPFVLRRRKEQVLKHLPPKSHEVVYCDMTPDQAALYKEEFSRNRRGLHEAADAAHAKEAAKSAVSQTTSKATSKASTPAQEQKALDNVLMQLRKAALHPLLFRRKYNDDLLRKMSEEIMREEQYKEANREYIFEDMTVMNDYELDRLCLNFPETIGHHKLSDEDYLESGKVRKLVTMLKEMKAAGDRVLLFSQFTQVLFILERVLESLGLSYLRMDGQTPVETRQDMIDRFHNEKDLDIFLLSTKAGGFGINLACANKVVIFDLSFNPHDDKQAEDRAHRVGQTRPVFVTRMVTRNSIEENIMQLANTKLALDQHVSADDDAVEAENEALVADMVLQGAPSKSATPDPSEADPSEPKAVAKTEPAGTDSVKEETIDRKPKKTVTLTYAPQKRAARSQNVDSEDEDEDDGEGEAESEEDFEGDESEEEEYE